MLSRPSSLIRPHPPVRRTPAPFPGSRLSVRSLTFQGHNILSALLTFRTFTAELSRIAAVCTPGNPMRAPQFFRIGSGHQGDENPLAFTNNPTSQFPGGDMFSSLGKRSFAFATALRFARPPTDLNRGDSVLLPAHEGFYFPAYRHRVAPVPAGYDYGAKLRSAPAGLSPASSAASLAAPHPSCHAGRPPSLHFNKSARVLLKMTSPRGDRFRHTAYFRLPETDILLIARLDPRSAGDCGGAVSVFAPPDSLAPSDFEGRAVAVSTARTH